MPIGPPRPRLDDVAARAGVSAATASLVLRGLPGPSEATRETVRRAASDLGYRPDRTASMLARRRTRLLGVVMDVGNSFHAELLEHLQAAADDRGYDLVVGPLTRTRDERRAVESLLDFRCEALLLLGPTMTDQALATLAGEHHVVVVGRRAVMGGVDVVRAADDVGMGLAVAHLVDLGHRSIALVDGPRGPIATLRRQGFRSAVRRLTGRLAPRILPGGDTEAAGADAARSLAGETALVVFNDRAALGVLDRLRRDGIGVPHEVSVVGYDDSPLSRLATVDLTSVSQGPEAMAEAAVASATQRLDEGRRASVEVVLDPHLVVRGSTAAPGTGQRATSRSGDGP